MSETETLAIVPMMPVEFLDRLQAIVNKFVGAARQVQETLNTEIVALQTDPAYLELAKTQQHLVNAITEAEMQRMAEALPQ